jgi:predicted RNase H-like HicB family nuclease
MTQGRTLKELEENLKDAYEMMVMEDVPAEHHEKAIAV